MNFAAPSAELCLESFQLMKNKFERALINYGSLIMTAIFQYAMKTERYEDCAIIKGLFGKYHLDMNVTVEEYQSYFWQIGLSGRAAVSKLNEFLAEALIMVGYPHDAITIKNCVPL